MRQLYYTIRYLLRGRGRNVIKVLSLTLGLGLGMGLIQFGAYISWGTDDSYLGYIHLRPGVFSESINRKISVLLPKYIDVEREKKQGFDMKLYQAGLGDIYAKYRGEADGGDHECTGFRFVISGGYEYEILEYCQRESGL